MEHVKKPCIGCVYFNACGSTTRVEPCKGRKTKREAKAEKKGGRQQWEIRGFVNAAKKKQNEVRCYLQKIVKGYRFDWFAITVMKN